MTCTYNITNSRKYTYITEYGTYPVSSFLAPVSGFLLHGMPVLCVCADDPPPGCYPARHGPTIPEYKTQAREPGSLENS